MLFASKSHVPLWELQHAEINVFLLFELLRWNANVLNKATREGQNLAVLQCFKILDIHMIVPPAKPFPFLSKLN